MQTMRLRLDLADVVDDGLLGAFCAAPELDRELVFGGQLQDEVETITSYVVGDASVYESILADDPAVLDFEVVPDENGCYAYVRRELGAGGMSFTHSLEQESVVVLPPIETRSDRTLTLTAVGRAVDLAAIVEELPEPIGVTVLWTRSGVPRRGGNATERQREALSAAWEVGYYEIPRENGIETVATELECSPSTASELLRMGEAAIIGDVLDVRSSL